MIYTKCRWNNKIMNAPTSSNVSHRVAASTQHKQRDFEALHKLHTFSTNTRVLNEVIKELNVQAFRTLCVVWCEGMESLTHGLVCWDWSILIDHIPKNPLHTADETREMSNQYNSTLLRLTETVLSPEERYRSADRSPPPAWWLAETAVYSLRIQKK